MYLLLAFLLTCLPLELISGTPDLPGWQPPTVCASPWYRDGATIEWEQRDLVIRGFYLEINDYSVSSASFTPRRWTIHEPWPQAGIIRLAEYREAGLAGEATYRVQWHMQYVPMVQ